MKIYKRDNLMREDFIPFSRPYITESDIESVNEVLRSGWITTGPKSAQFEREFCKYTGARNAVAMTSQTCIMQALIHILGIGPGDEVITPSMTWVSLPNIVELAGAKPIFVDCDKDNLMVTPEIIEKAITPRTKLIVPVHFAGAPYDIDGIADIGDKYGVTVIEDAAHALGASYKGRKVGNKGISLFSFHAIKNITTAEGGMFVCSDNSLADRMRNLKFHGIGVDAYDRTTFGRAPQAQVIEPGFKFNMTDIQAALGLGQLSKLDIMNKRRKELSEYYLRSLQDIDEIMPLVEPTNYKFEHSNHLFIVRLDIDKTHISRDEFMEELKTKQIGTGLHFRCIHKQKYYLQKYPNIILPSTEWNSDRIFSLPLHLHINEDDIDYIVTSIKEILRK